MTQFKRNIAFTLRRTWLAVMLLAVVANVVAYVTHEHSAEKSQSQTVVCDWCVTHAGFATPPQLPQVSALVLVAIDRPLIHATAPLVSTPVLAARPRGPPHA